MARSVRIVLTFTSIVVLSFSIIRTTGQDYKFRHLTTKQGLPSNAVQSIIKDHNGFMWFGTLNGLVRYDGYNFTTWLNPYDSLLKSDSQDINQVYEDKEGNLWVGTAHRGLWLFDRIKGTFSSFSHQTENSGSLGHNTVNKIYQDKQGILWIGTNGGLNKFNPVTDQFISYKQSGEKPENNRDQVFVIFEDRKENFWIGTAEGLFLFDRKKEIFTAVDMGIEIPGQHYRRVTCITEDEKGRMWIGTYYGLVKYDPVTNQSIHYLPGDLQPAIPGEYAPGFFISNIYVESIVATEVDGQTCIWIATQWGLNRFYTDIEQFDHFLEDKSGQNSISTSYLKDLYFDDKGQLWIGTPLSGIEVLNTMLNPFNKGNIRFSNNGTVTYPACFLCDDEDILWIGATDGGLFQYDKNFGLMKRYAHWVLGENAFDERQHNHINCIFEDDAHRLWLGYLYWGLVMFDKEEKKFHHIELQNNFGKPSSNIIKNFLQDHYGTMWIGTMEGLYTRNKGDDILAPARVIPHEVLGKEDIFCMFEDSRLNLWISTRYHGLFCLSPADRDSLFLTQYQGHQSDIKGFLGNFVNSICEDQDGTLWFGTDQGLNRFNREDKTFIPDVDFNEDYGGCIINFCNDEFGNLWILHSIRGLVRYKPYADKTAKLKVFDESDGLPFDNFRTAPYDDKTFYQSDDGRIFIAGVIGSGDGFFWFHPEKIKDNNLIPPVAITSFNIVNQDVILDSTISYKQHIVLRDDQNFFSFGFSALDYGNSEKNQYAYYLEGYESDWIFSGTRRFANYTGVPPGNYTFRVKGTNNDGYWNEAGTSLRITILPPFWKTWWAYILYGLVIISILYSIFHYYLRRQSLVHMLELEKVEAEKLKELDGMKSRFFANISHEFRTPLTLILGIIEKFRARFDDKAGKTDLNVMLRNTIRLRRLIDQLLSLASLEAGKMKLNASQVNLVQETRNYMQFFESAALRKGIQLDFYSENDEVFCFVDRDKFEKILYNLFSNAIKFTTEGGRVLVTVSSQQSAVSSQQSAVITVADNGPGIAPQHLPYIFDRFYQAVNSDARFQEGTGIGLALAKELVGLHRGEIKVESEVGKGTTFSIYLPLGKEHLREEEVDESRQSSVVSRQSEFEPETWNLPARLNDFSHSSVEPVTRNPEPVTDNPLLLIVEDNADLRHYLHGFLSESYEIQECGDGKAGFEKAVENIPDLVISDVMMPGMDGHELCRQLKSDERTSHIPVILLTARVSEEDKLEGFETGADDFITKPFQSSELLIRAKNLIEQRRLLREKYRREFEHISLIPDKGMRSADARFMEKAREVLGKNLANPAFDTVEFSREMNLSRVQLHRKLNALFNLSATAFIRTYRLNAAARMLEARSGNVAQIAYEVGFNNLSYFSRCFRQQFGVNPSEYLSGHSR